MRNTVNLSSDWSFRISRSTENGGALSPRTIALPYCEKLTEKNAEYIFTHSLAVGADSGETDYYLEFSRITGHSEIYIDSEKAGVHTGNSVSFRINISDYIKPGTEQTLEVRAVPQTDTYGNFIFSGVSLVSAGKTHFHLPSDGAPCIGVHTVLTTGTAQLHIGTTVTNPNNYDVISYSVFDSHRNEVAAKTVKPTSPECELTLNSPVLWAGQHAAEMYTLDAEIIRDSIVLDKVSVPFAVRNFELKKDGFFYISNMRLPLNGIELTSTDAVQDDRRLFNELDANTLRLSSLPCDTDILSLCDKSGTLVWFDFPYSGQEDTIYELRDFVRQNGFHPSLCFISCSYTADTSFLKDFTKTVRENSDFIFTAAVCDALKAEDINDVIPDILAYRVPGNTNERGFSELEAWFSELKAAHGEYHFVIIADSPECIYSRNCSHAVRNDCSQEYFCGWHEKLWSIFCREKGVFGFFAGKLSDTAENSERTGLVTFDRSLKKDAFWFYKAQFSADGFIKLCSTGIKQVQDKTIDIKCYSNVIPSGININGKAVRNSQYTEISGNVFLFRNIKLNKKNNLIEVFADKHSDSTEIFRTHSLHSKP